VQTIDACMGECGGRVEPLVPLRGRLLCPAFAPTEATP